MLTTRELQRIDNKIKPRTVTGWTLTGTSYPRGQRMPGSVKLDLEGGGWLWYPEDTPLDHALADADDRGFGTATVRAELAAWVATGKGATFQLSRPDGSAV